MLKLRTLFLILSCAIVPDSPAQTQCTYAVSLGKSEGVNSSFQKQNESINFEFLTPEQTSALLSAAGGNLQYHLKIAEINFSRNKCGGCHGLDIPDPDDRHFTVTNNDSVVDSDSDNSTNLDDSSLFSNVADGSWQQAGSYIYATSYMLKGTGWMTAPNFIGESSKDKAVVRVDPSSTENTVKALVVTLDHDYPVTGPEIVRTVAPLSLVKGNEYTYSPSAEDKKRKQILVTPYQFKIYNGLNASTSVVDPVGVGAVTIANINDTDNNGTPDKDDTLVIGEKDLMKLEIKGFDGLDGKIRLNFNNPTVKIWEGDYKVTPISFTSTLTLDIDIPIGGPVDKTVWLEATAASTSLRDITVSLSYVDSSGTVYSNLDSVKATAIWVTKTDHKNQVSHALWSDVQEPLKTTFLNMGKFGHNRSNGIGIFNVIGFQFTIAPSGAASIPNVKFDIGRQLDGQSWYVVNGVMQPTGLYHGPFTNNDYSTDDANNADESLTGVGNHLYSYDHPGFEFQTMQYVGGQLVTQAIYRKNFYEFARVSFDGTVPAGDGIKGTRCSNKIAWHTSLWVWRVGTNSIYQNRSGKPLSIDIGHSPILPAPTP